MRAKATILLSFILLTSKVEASTSSLFDSIEVDQKIDSSDTNADCLTQAEPSLQTNLDRSNSILYFSVSNIEAYSKISYHLLYSHDNIDEAITGDFAVKCQSKFSEEIFLGSCSGSSCTANKNLTKITLLLQLKNNSNTKTLEKEF